MENYLNDIKFLNEVFKNRQRSIKVRISSLTFDEKFLESIEGKVTDGNINVDGKSSVRRTCNLTLVTQQLNINNEVWGLNTKFKLEIGIKNPFYNTLDNIYPEFLWFPQGIFLITSFSRSISTNSNTISISGKDKMVLLNGEISGHFTQSTVLDKILTANGKEKYPIINLIYDMLYLYGNEKNYNIIINDLDKLGVEMQKYIGSGNIYLQQGLDNDFQPIIGRNAFNLLESIDSSTFDSICEDWNGENSEFINRTEIPDLSAIVFSNFTDNLNLENQTVFKKGNSYFLLYKINYGDIVGYKATPLVYNDDLITQPGETITSVLDKIVSMFGGSYEYFYNVQGQFIFQKKKSYIDTAWQPYSYFIENNIITVSQEDEEFIFNFEDTSLITNMNFSPSINTIKNDYIIYGETENGYPLHLRYAIDIKPSKYTTIRNEIPNTTYVTSFNIREDYNEEEQSSFPTINDNINESGPATGANQWEWNSLQFPKQLIYKTRKNIYFSMASNNYLNSLGTEQAIQIGMFLRFTYRENSWVFKVIDIQKTQLGRYRIYLDQSANKLTRKMYEVSYQKYKQNNQPIINNSQVKYNVKEQEHNNIVLADWRELIYQMALDFDACGQNDNYAYNLHLHNPTMLNGKTGYEQYYTDIQGFWPEVYRIPSENEEDEPIMGWYQEKLQDPNQLFFWLEFIEGDSALNNLSVKNIGDRTLVKNDKKISCLFELPVPPILLYDNTEDIPQTTLNYSPCGFNTDTLGAAFSIASYPKAAKTVMDTELSNGTFFAKPLNLTIIPIYYLDVNHKIKVKDLENNIEGQFLINSFNISLNYNGTMTLNTKEIIEPLY